MSHGLSLSHGGRKKKISRRKKDSSGYILSGMKPLKTFAVLAALLLPLCAAAQTLAYLGAQNSAGDSRYDYVGSLVSGIIQYDLSSTPGIALVERSSLDAILREQEISLSLGKADAVKLGQILGAEYIVKAEYSVVGSELSFTLSLIDAATAQTFSFSDRGADENLIHAQAERLVKKLTGKDVTFRSQQRKRSLLSLKDVTPGSISLFCGLVDAEILLDGEFAGYSKGNAREAIRFEGLEPGPHELKLKLRGFGMAKLPEVIYQDWQQIVDVQPGKTAAVKAEAWLYSDIYYQLKRVKTERFTLAPESGVAAKEGRIEFEFLDRKGKAHPVIVSYTANRKSDSGTIAAIFSLDGERQPLDLSCPAGKEASAQLSLGPLNLAVSIDLKSSIRNTFLLELTRVDIVADEWLK